MKTLSNCQNKTTQYKAISKISTSHCINCAIRQSLFRQNVLGQDSPNFNNVKVSRYTVTDCIIQLIPVIPKI